MKLESLLHATFTRWVDELHTTPTFTTEEIEAKELRRRRNRQRSWLLASLVIATLTALLVIRKFS